MKTSRIATVALGLAAGCVVSEPEEPLPQADSEHAPDRAAHEPSWVVAFHEAPDDSVQDDLRYLAGDAEVRIVDTDAIEAFADGDAILLEYLGKGEGKKTEVAPPDDLPIDEEAVREADDSAYSSLTGANMFTGNRFQLRMPRQHLARFADLTPWVDPERDPVAGELDVAASSPGPSDFDEPEGFAAQIDPQHAWSNNYDSRTQIYGTNAPVGGVNNWLVDFGNCSGATVGERHIVTAAHCVTDYGSNATSWNLEGVEFRVGRNGSSNDGMIEIDTNNIPPGEVAWWWASTGWTGGTAGGIADFAIVTLPGSFGCQSFSGQCNFAYGFTSKSSLLEEAIYHRGYPVCDPFSAGGVHRIDEPCQSNGQTPASCGNYGGALCTTPCRDDHVYGQGLACGWGDFSDSGRRFWHGCDVSAGDSGAPVYYNKSGTWTLAGVHYFSDCGKSCSESCAGESRPSRATRITKGRRNWINWFVDNWPNYG